jgi:hypothetical protein
VKIFERQILIHREKLTTEDGTDIGYRNVGSKNSDAGEISRRIYISFTTGCQFFNLDLYLYLFIFTSSLQG